MKTFIQLATRVLPLYPDEHRIIFRIEVEPKTLGNFTLRVASSLMPGEGAAA